ncbi:radical SAM protein [Blautia intestinalis]|uniref:radical SAM protein n=1 Tax=Blautia intestinalis TaxID=2763028 RepID=UPI0022E426E9|nr:radical SAM protein [Blautia intestinalis]
MIFGDKNQMNETDMILHLMEACRLCPRECDVNRLEGKKGFCGVDAKVMVARAALHMWEEPCISGKEGSGAVFFSGCSLGCGFCQNRRISRGQSGKQITIEHLVDIFLNLQEQKANNINLVTAGQFLPQVAEALKRAKAQELHIPVVYNSSGYEKAEMLKMLDGLVDIYLPDFKYMDPELAGKYSHAKDYPQVAKLALEEMVRQVGMPEFDSCGMMKRGVIVRHLLLPGHVKNSKNVLKYLYETYRDKIYISMMNQYTPMPTMKDDPQLSRKVTDREYARLINYAISLGLNNGFIQEGETAKESFIPEFDGEGV